MSSGYGDTNIKTDPTAGRISDRPPTGMQEPARDPEMVLAIQKLKHSVDDLEKSTINLHNRLTPILRAQEPCVSEEKSIENKISTVPLVATIIDINRRIAAIANANKCVHSLVEI